jgi:hypothetical protein
VVLAVKVRLKNGYRPLQNEPSREANKTLGHQPLLKETLLDRDANGLSWEAIH